MRREVVIYTSNRKPIPMEGRALVTIRCYFTGRRYGETCNPYNIMTHYEGTGLTLANARAKCLDLAIKDGWEVSNIRNVVPA
jgi:hypothetical protein